MRPDGTSSKMAPCLKTILAASSSCLRSPRVRARQIQHDQITPATMARCRCCRPGRQAKTGTGGLSGRIVAGDTGIAVRRAQVRISGPDIGTKTALTDAQGRYEFKDLPAGRFNVSVSKSGFVTMQYGQSRPFEPGRPIELADAQMMDKADVALPRGSVLAGRVVDEFGEAVAEADVTAMRMQYHERQARRLVPSGRNAYDQRSRAVPHLRPAARRVLRQRDAAQHGHDGDATCSARGGAGGPTGSNQNSGYAATYYPSTPNPGEAQRVAVAVGQELVERRHPAPAGQAGEDHRQRDRIRRQADDAARWSC